MGQVLKLIKLKTIQYFINVIQAYCNLKNGVGESYTQCYGRVQFVFYFCISQKYITKTGYIM